MFEKGILIKNPKIFYIDNISHFVGIDLDFRQKKLIEELDEMNLAWKSDITKGYYVLAQYNPLSPFRVEEHEDLNLYIYSFLIGKKKEYSIYLTRMEE